MVLSSGRHKKHPQTNSNASDNGWYYCVFQDRHTNDDVKIDKFSRWWTEWYRYTKPKEPNGLVYKQQIVIRPNACPNSSE